jgi:hypothetical protein
MTPEHVEELLNEYGKRLWNEDLRRYGTDNCPPAWRFIDARRNPWMTAEKAHFAGGCPYCAKTREMLSNLNEEERAAEADIANAVTTTPAGFDAIFPGLSYLAGRLGTALDGIKSISFIDGIRSLDWSACSISLLPLATAAGITQPGHFGSATPGTSFSGTESDARQVESIAKEAGDPETREILLALAADLRSPGSGIARLKDLCGTGTPEAALLLAICYRRLGSNEDAEAQLKRVIGLLRKEM